MIGRRDFVADRAALPLVMFDGKLCHLVDQHGLAHALLADNQHGLARRRGEHLAPLPQLLRPADERFLIVHGKRGPVDVAECMPAPAPLSLPHHRCQEKHPEYVAQATSGNKEGQDEKNCVARRSMQSRMKSAFNFHSNP